MSWSDELAEKLEEVSSQSKPIQNDWGQKTVEMLKVLWARKK